MREQLLCQNNIRRATGLSIYPAAKQALTVLKVACCRKQDFLSFFFFINRKQDEVLFIQFSSIQNFIADSWSK